MPRPHGHCKFQHEWLVEMFLKSAVSPGNVLEFYFQRVVCTLVASVHVGPLFVS